MAGPIRFVAGLIDPKGLQELTNGDVRGIPWSRNFLTQTTRGVPRCRGHSRNGRGSRVGGHLRRRWLRQTESPFNRTMLPRAAAAIGRARITAAHAGYCVAAADAVAVASGGRRFSCYPRHAL